MAKEARSNPSYSTPDIFAKTATVGPKTFVGPQRAEFAGLRLQALEAQSE